MEARENNEKEGKIFQIYEEIKKCGMKDIVKVRLSTKSESEE